LRWRLKRFLDIGDISKATGKNKSVSEEKVYYMDNTVMCYVHGACNCVSLWLKDKKICKIYRCLACNEGAYVEVEEEN